MKKKLFSIFIVIFFIFIIFNIFYNSLEINKVISLSFSTFIKNIFPSLFPMFIISNLLIAIGLPEFLSNIFSKIMNKLFNVKGYGSFVFFMSMLSGFPSNAKYLKELLDKKLIDEIDANKIILFTFFSNPLFVINTVGVMFFNDIKIGLLLLITHILGNIIVGILFRNLFKRKEVINTNINIKKSLKTFYYQINNTNFFKAFLKSINNALSTLLNILGIITCFLIIVEIFNISFNLSPFVSTLFKGILEFSTGLKSLSSLNLTLNLKIYIAAFFISFGGFSVHAQVFNILENYNIKYYLFFLARIIHSLITIILMAIIINL